MAIAYTIPTIPPLNTFALPPNPRPQIMVDLKLPLPPPDFKNVVPFLQRAQEVRTRDPYICYWSLYYVARLGMAHPKTRESQPFLAAVVEHLEGMKRSMRSRRQITDEAAGSSYVRRFGFNVFEAANKEDLQGNATRATAKKFLAASYFLEILKSFGPLDAEVEETMKYAKFKAGDIVRSLREGNTPTPGPPGLRYTTNGPIITPSNLSPQTNPILLSTRPSALHSPVESPTPARPLLQPNYPPAPTESGSPVSPRQDPDVDAARPPESVALPNSGSSRDIPLPSTASPKKRQSPVLGTRSPLSAPVLESSPVNVSSSPTGVSPRSSPVKRPKLLPTAATLASPIRSLEEVSATPAPITQQQPPQQPLPHVAEQWAQQGTASPTMSSTLTIDSADTFTSSQLQTVIRSGSMAMLAGARSPVEQAESPVQRVESPVQLVESPVEAESVASTEESSASETSSADSPLMPVLTVVDDLATVNEIEVARGTEEAHTSNLVTIPSPIVDDWDLGREVTQAIRELTPTPPSADTSPLAMARGTPMPESPESDLLATPTQTPEATTLSLESAGLGTRPRPTVVVPQSPTQPSPTSNISSRSPSNISPVSLDMAQNPSFQTAAELIDTWKVYGKLDARAREPEIEANIGIEDESGSSISSGSSGSEHEDDEDDAASSDDDGQSVSSEIQVSPTEDGAHTDDEAADGGSGSELKSLIKSSTETATTKKTVRFAESVVGGLSPEMPKQILPPLVPAGQTSPPLQIIPASMVAPSSQPLVRPKSLMIRSSFETNYQQGSPMTPDSPSYMNARPTSIVGLPQITDGRPPEDFAIIPFHPSMAASHPAPAIQNNPAYSTTAIVHASWGSSSSPPKPPNAAFRHHSHTVDRETAVLAQKYSRFAISSLNYMDVETAKKELRAALALLEGES